MAYSASFKKKSICSKKRRTSIYRSWSFPRVVIIAAVLFSAMNFTIAPSVPSSIIKKVWVICSLVTFPCTILCSKSVIASRSHHFAKRAMRLSASLSYSIPSDCAINSSREIISSRLIFLKSNRCTRDRIVSGTLSISVVARMNLTCDGGSSSVLRSALNAHFESI